MGTRRTDTEHYKLRSRQDTSEALPSLASIYRQSGAGRSRPAGESRPVRTAPQTPPPRRRAPGPPLTRRHRSSRGRDSSAPAAASRLEPRFPGHSEAAPPAPREHRSGTAPSDRRRPASLALGPERGPRRRISGTPQHRPPEPQAFPARPTPPPLPVLTGPTIAVATVDAPVAMARPPPAHAQRRGRVGAEGPSTEAATPGDRRSPPPRTGPARKSRRGRSATHCGTRRRGCRAPRARLRRRARPEGCVLPRPGSGTDSRKATPRLRCRALFIELKSLGGSYSDWRGTTRARAAPHRAGAPRLLPALFQPRPPKQVRIPALPSPPSCGTSTPSSSGESSHRRNATGRRPWKACEAM